MKTDGSFFVHYVAPIWRRLFLICVMACPLLQIRLAVWVHKSDEQAKRWEYAFMRILLHEIRVFYGGSGGKVYLMINDTENICAKLAQCLLNAIYQRKNVFFHNKCR